jgi:hypothetical protein
MVNSRREADLIVYLKPPWSDADARDSLRNFSPRELMRTYVYSQAPEPFPWAPGMYLNMPEGRAGSAFKGGFYVAHHHHEEGGLGDDLEAARDTKTDLLWSFLGTISNHPVRRPIMEIEDDRALVQDTQAWSDRVRWAWKDDFQKEGRAAFSDFATTLGRSSFVVSPRGRGASSIRLFEALQVGRCPVIISDDWLAPSGVSWSSCSIKIAESRVKDLPAVLREREGEAAALGASARQVWEQHFAPERRLATLVAACVEISEAAPHRSTVLAKASLHPETVRRGIRAARSRL